MRALALIVLTFAAAASAVAQGSPVQPDAAIVDRTLLCRTALTGGVREASTLAHAGTGRTGGAWKRPALAAVTTGQGGSAFTVLDPWLAWVTSGKPTAAATVVQDPYANVTYPIRVWGTVAWNARLCRETSGRVPLDTRGLSGAATGPFDETFDCPTPQRVLVRVRATPAGIAKAGSYRQFVRWVVPFSQAEIAVATLSGKRLAYAEVSASGKARVLTSRSCSPS